MCVRKKSYARLQELGKVVREGVLGSRVRGGHDMLRLEVGVTNAHVKVQIQSVRLGDARGIDEIFPAPAVFVGGEETPAFELIRTFYVDKMKIWQSFDGVN